MTILSPTDAWPQITQKVWDEEREMFVWRNVDMPFHEFICSGIATFLRKNFNRPTYLMVGKKAKRKLIEDINSIGFYQLDIEENERYMDLIVLDTMKEGVILA